MSDPKMMAVKSSNLNAIGYDQETETLVVEFKGGGRYAYSDVPAEVFMAFQDADSAGKFFHREVKGQYPAERLG